MIKDPHFSFVVVDGQRAAVSLWPPLKEALSTSFLRTHQSKGLDSRTGKTCVKGEDSLFILGLIKTWTNRCTESN